MMRKWQSAGNRCRNGVHRCHRDHLESYCTLELKRRPHTDVQVKVCLYGQSTAQNFSICHEIVMP
jgi:hypothetical protein